MTDSEALRAHAERIKASGVLGRSPLMQKLFDFLLECSAAGKAPKEIEVAVDAFGVCAQGFGVGHEGRILARLINENNVQGNNNLSR